MVVPVNDDGVTLFNSVASPVDKSIDEVRVLSIPRERAVDVAEGIVVPGSIDDKTADDMILLGVGMDVLSIIEEVVKSVDN